MNVCVRVPFLSPSMRYLNPSLITALTVSICSLSASSLPSGALSRCQIHPFETHKHTDVTRQDTSKKYVFAHHVVGFTFPYIPANWKTDIDLAHEYGIDAFALNIGQDSWQADRVADAYQVAGQSGTGFSLFLSFDMSAISPCNTPDSATLLRSYIIEYAGHPAQFKYNGRMFVSTFAGESCTFGHATVDEGWREEFVQHPDVLNATSGMGIYFVPSFFVSPGTFASFADIMDGYFGWNSGWPITLTTDVARSTLHDSLNGTAETISPSPLDKLTPFIGATTQDDQNRKGLLPLSGERTYMAAASPWFFTHYPADGFNKNFIYLADQHLYQRRWENLVSTRNNVQFVEIVTWNDYSESHYVGPIEGALPDPQQTKLWTDGMDHQGWLRLTKYYSQTFKTGSYPTIGNDELYMWSRPQPAFATTNDPVPKPTNFELVEDRLWALAIVPSAAAVVITFTPSSGEPTVRKYDVEAGVNRISFLYPNGKDGIISGFVERNGNVTLQMGGMPQGKAFQWHITPKTENFNAWVAVAISDQKTSWTLAKSFLVMFTSSLSFFPSRYFFMD